MRCFGQVEGTKKGRGRPKIILIEVIKKDMSIKKVTKNMTMDNVVKIVKYSVYARLKNRE